jgi:hypothetical protein
VRNIEPRSIDFPSCPEDRDRITRHSNSPSIMPPLAAGFRRWAKDETFVLGSPPAA